MSKLETVMNKAFYVFAVLGLAVLAVAGMLHLTAGIDAVIAYPITTVTVAFLLREIL